MKLIILGPQGCGKGTIGSMLSDYLHIPIFSIGQMLRDVPKDNPHYSTIHEDLLAGRMVDKTLLRPLSKSVSLKMIVLMVISWMVGLDGWKICRPLIPALIKQYF
jgi:adenylate kinase family enzyme